MDTNFNFFLDTKLYCSKNCDPPAAPPPLKIGLRNLL